MSKTIYFLSAIMAGSMPTQAAAKQIYLDCTRGNGENSSLREKFTLDEGARSGTHAIPSTGLSTGELPADFGQKQVVLTSRSPIGGMVNEYVFDRVTLSYTLLRTIGTKLYTHRGKCTLGKPPVRKF